MTRAYFRQAYLFGGGTWPDTSGGGSRQPPVTVAVNNSDTNGPYQTNPAAGVAPSIWWGGFMQSVGYYSGLVFVGPALSAGVFSSNVAIQSRHYSAGGSAGRTVYFVYIWRPSNGTRISPTVVEVDGGAMSGTGVITVASGTATLGNVTVAAGDRVIVEVWAHCSSAVPGSTYRQYRDTSAEYFEYDEPAPAATLSWGGPTQMANIDPDFGSDVSTFPDVPVGLPLMTGRRVLGEALLRRLMTPRGLLRFHPDYGMNIRDFLHDGVTDEELHRLKANVEAEAEKDERVSRANCVLSYDRRAMTLRLQLEVETAVAPYRLTVLITRLTTELLEG